MDREGLLVTQIVDDARSARSYSKGEIHRSTRHLTKVSSERGLQDWSQYKSSMHHAATSRFPMIFGMPDVAELFDALRPLRDHCDPSGSVQMAHLEVTGVRLERRDPKSGSTEDCLSTALPSAVTESTADISRSRYSRWAHRSLRRCCNDMSCQ